MSDETVSKASAWQTPDFRQDLAFAKMTEDMVERLRAYGQEERFAAGVTLFRQGARQVDMYVVLEGEIEISIPGEQGESKVIANHRRFDFSGELNLLTSQGSLVEARTMMETVVLRIPRGELQRLMRAQGDIANLITSATVWRRIGIIGEATGGIVLMGHGGMRR